MSRRRRVIVGILCLGLVAPLLAACFRARTGCREPKVRSDADLSPAEIYVLKNFFKMQVTKRVDGTMDATLQPTFWGWAPSSVKDEEEIYHRYRKQLFDAHYALVREDQSYAERFQCLVDFVVDRVGLEASRKDGCECVFPEALRLGLYHDLLKRIGPLPFLDVPPPFAGYDPCGTDDSEPFASFWEEAVPSDASASVMPFHYCSGTGGITISGGDQDPYVRAHEWLQRHDQEYARTFDEVMRPFLERAEKVDRFDFEATAAITHDLRRAMVDAGLADEIQKRADRGNSNSGKQEASGESQEREN